MAKDPAFLFYTGDFSTGTQFMTDEQVGKYIRLMMAQHQHGHLTEKQMLHICKTYDKDVFDKFEKDADGLYYNVRLDAEIANRKRYCNSRSNNRKGGDNQQDNTKTTNTNISSTYVPHMENENKDENRIKDKEERKGEFKSKLIEFRAEYSDQMLKEFFEYWTESNAKGKKLRFEMEKVFDIKRRLNTWASRSKSFVKPGKMQAGAMDVLNVLAEIKKEGHE